MNRTTLLVSALLLAVILPTVAWSWAGKDDAGPLRAEAKRLLEESSEHTKRGELDIARELLNKARRLLDQASEHPGRPPYAHPPQSDRHPAPSHAMSPHHPPHGYQNPPPHGECHPPHAGPHPPGPPHSPHDEAHHELEQRMHHLQTAVEHLQHAGQGELAEQAMHRLEQTREEIQRVHQQTPHAGPHPQEIHRHLEQLAHEVRELRELILRIAREHDNDEEENDDARDEDNRERNDLDREES